MKVVHFIPSSQRRIALEAAQSDSKPVLITGAGGTGKSAIARWIFRNSPRAGLPYAVANKKESLKLQIPRVQSGSLFIPEAGDLPLREQQILIDFLRTRSIPHSDESEVRMLLNVRIITSSTLSLEKRVEARLFNAELLERLSTFRIHMPELSERDGEFDDIATALLKEITHELQKDYIKGFSSQAWERLHAYHWPGNIRELRNVLRISVIQTLGNQIELKDLPDFGHDRIDFRANREEFEKIYILELLKTFDWQIEKTAKKSHLDKEVLIAKMKKFGIDPTSVRSVP